MNQTTVVTITELEAAGVDWRNDPQYVYVGRASAKHSLKQSKWHNPNRIRREHEISMMLRAYRVHLERSPELLVNLPELRGKTLVQLPFEAHAGVLIELLEELEHVR